ncbi:hypothetical protein [Ramlibacter sp.]
MKTTPQGITPPTPGLDREEPEFDVTEADIPGDDGGWALAEFDTVDK